MAEFGAGCGGDRGLALAAGSTVAARRFVGAEAVAPFRLKAQAVAPLQLEAQAAAPLRPGAEAAAPLRLGAGGCTRSGAPSTGNSGGVGVTLSRCESVTREKPSVGGDGDWEGIRLCPFAPEPFHFL
ncbi:unnamed protein product [Miscanthus lutarioriparius]|uniref:Uncharacterized protein n=1 Tax=Miscanthus lutarioriparius TaxID=422564 RepID=A0A811P3Y7_9POAL|nr:unnamed protein product [Miscanthus lutarioriparius]